MDHGWAHGELVLRKTTTSQPPMVLGLLSSTVEAEMNGAGCYDRRLWERTEHGLSGLEQRNSVVPWVMIDGSGVMAWVRLEL
jgi:hypothetical protein